MRRGGEGGREGGREGMDGGAGILVEQLEASMPQIRVASMRASDDWRGRKETIMPIITMCAITYSRQGRGPARMARRVDDWCCDLPEATRACSSCHSELVLKRTMVAWMYRFL